MEKLTDGLILFCKKECATCTMIVPVIKELSKGDKSLTIFTQDDPGFPEGIPGVVNDTLLEHSYHFQIETVPTLISLENGQEIRRTVGWDREEWRTITGIKGLGEGLPPFRPGCGSKNV